MEELKPFSELLSPDPRSVLILLNRQTGESRPLTLEDVYRDASQLRLNETVPEGIRNHFVTALHLGVYSWFVYRFTMLSQQQAYATLEWALRERLAVPSSKKRPHLADLFQEAISNGLLKGRNFRRWTVIGGDSTNDESADAWLRDTVEMMRHFRNELAHGSRQLISMHWIVLELVADAVNQLYPAE